MPKPKKPEAISAVKLCRRYTSIERGKLRLSVCNQHFTIDTAGNNDAVSIRWFQQMLGNALRNLVEQETAPKCLCKKGIKHG